MAMSRINRKQLGELGEQAAEQALKEQGLGILARNWRCRTGEIDLVALDGEVLVFVEVRTRSTEAFFGTPQESVDARKQMKVRQTAQYYLLHHNNQSHRQVRFDVVSVRTDSQGTLQQMEHIRSAF